MEQEADIAIVGGGIVGLATAFQIGRAAPGDPRGASREGGAASAAHQTGHNSGVIHSGIYYKPGSLKATNCRRGKALLEAFCREHGIAFETCGKVVVAIDARRAPAARRHHRARPANGVACELIGPERLRELEPHAAGRAGAARARDRHRRLRARSARSSRPLVRSAAGHGRRPGPGCSGSATARERRARDLGRRASRARVAVNCAGLHSDRVARR